ncbi:MAG: 6-bladed beta-propeller [Candidatus Pacebacteria bacterium]|nr:6-bladed beta-propeller [Candidatus Paceibacterota bacterium]MDD5357067.1 6-bladed beta-propeller [Candidatus Paceibacterota bacterium]
MSKYKIIYLSVTASFLFLLAFSFCLPKAWADEPTPAFLFKIPSAPALGALASPTYVAISTSTGNMYVVDSANDRIQKFDSSGTPLAQFGSNGTGDGQFYTPRGIALDPGGNIFVSDSLNHRIEKFNSSGTFVSAFGWGVSDGSSAFQTCTSSCQAGISGAGNGEFYRPWGIAISTTTGNIYVADQFNHRVQIFDSGFSYIGQFGSGGSGDGQFYYPRGIALDSSDNVYIVDLYGARVEKFDSSGNYLSKFGSSGSGDGNFGASYPGGIAVSTVTGDIYVVDSANDRVEKFDSAGTFLATFGWGISDGSHALQTCTSSCRAGISGAGRGQFDGNTQSDESLGIALDASDNVYVVDTVNGRIAKFDSSDLSFVSQFGTTEGEFSHPRSLTIATTTGDIYVADTDGNRIEKFNSSGTFVSAFGWGVSDGSSAFQTCTSGCLKGIAGSGDGQLNGPYGIALDSSGNIYVTDAENNRVQKFDSSGNYVSKFGLYGSLGGNFTVPGGIVLDPAGNIYIADRDQYRVQKLDSSGDFLYAFGWGVLTGANAFEVCTVSLSCHAGIQGSGEGQLSNFPEDIALDPEGNIFITDPGNSRVQEFSPAPAFIGQFGVSGSGNGQFNYPFGIAVSTTTGNIYVVDANNNRIQKFDSSGNYLSKFGSGGSGEGAFSSPTDVGLDSSENIYVMDTFNNRIQKFAQQPAIDIAPTALTVEKGSSATYNVMVVNKEPTDDVVVTISPDSYETVSSSTLTFTSANYLTPQTVTVTAIQDNLASDILTGTITHAASSIDPDFDTYSVSNVTVTIPAYTPPPPTPTPTPSPTHHHSGGGGASVARIQQFAPAISLTPPPASSDSAVGPASAPSVPARASFFTRPLRVGFSGPDVKALQVFLNTHGFPLALTGLGSLGHETNFFGAKTKEALKKFQEAHAPDILIPQGLSHGTGFFGASTRKFVNGLVQ